MRGTPKRGQMQWLIYIFHSGKTKYVRTVGSSKMVQVKVLKITHIDGPIGET